MTADRYVAIDDHSLVTHVTLVDDRIHCEIVEKGEQSQG